MKLDEEDFFEQMLHDLFLRKIHSLLVEGGAIIHNEFVKKQLWDEMRVFKAPTRFGEGIAAPGMPDQVLKEALLPEGDTLFIFEKHKAGAYNQ